MEKYKLIKQEVLFLANKSITKLKQRKDVEYRVGGQGEGGVGATVVTFVSRK